MSPPLRVRRVLPWLALGAAAVTLVSFVTIDPWLAGVYDRHGVGTRAAWTDVRRAIDDWTGLTAERWFVDDVTGLALHKYFVATLFVMLGAVAFALPRIRGHARVWWYAATVHVVARLLTNEVKDATGRLRPSEWLARGGDDATFGQGGVSFPSGHTSYYLGVVLPIAVAWPRIGVPLLVLPAFMGWSRIAVNAHFFSDVTGSVALVSILAWMLAYAFRIDGRPRWRR